MTGRTRAWRCVSMVASLMVFHAAAAPAGVGWSYARLHEKLLEGEKPRVVIHLAGCVDPAGRGGPAVIALSNFATYNLTPQFIATSETHLFEDSSSGAMSLQYARLRLYPNGSAELWLRRLNPTTYEPLAPPSVLRCRLDDGSITLRGEQDTR